MTAEEPNWKRLNYLWSKCDIKLSDQLNAWIEKQVDVGIKIALSTQAREIFEEVTNKFILPSEIGIEGKDGYCLIIHKEDFKKLKQKWVKSE